MTGPVVAKIWWEAPHDGALERFMVGSDVIAFGRGGECAIRIGHAPVYQAQVPRIWGELSWHRGSVIVHNLSARWGLALVPMADAASKSSWVDIAPGGSASSPETYFRILAKAPDTEISIIVQTSAAQRLSAVIGGDDPPSFVPFSLTPSQQVIGTAVIAPLLAGGPRRASYTEVAATTHYAVRTVRENIAAMDGLFVLHRLVDLDKTAGDSLDRVAYVLRAHPSLLGSNGR